MRLTKFIRRDMESILSQWQAFANSIPAAASMDAATLRDHAEQILRAVCLDIDQAQTPLEQSAKSKGLAPPLDARETAAQTHALLRARSGFDINQMAAEYRALRASVLALWGAACAPEPVDLQDVIRFNEAIDQALAESILFFSAEVDRGRDLLLGILGHDLRNPLNAIQLTATHLQTMNAGVDVSAAAGRLIRSGARMKALLDDLTDFNRTKLGVGLIMAPADMDIGQSVSELVQQIGLSYPGRTIDMQLNGRLHGRWDARRMDQVVSNLVVNALRYGSVKGPVQVSLSGLETDVVFSVANVGPRVPPEVLGRIFEPLVRGPDREETDGGMGLGLYICREIVRAHGGSIVAESTDGSTTFTVRLPREPADLGR